MEFDDAIRRQRMRRPPYAPTPIADDVLDTILSNAQKAPSAGFSQGVAMLVLRGAEIATFTRHTGTGGDHIAAIVIPLQHKQAYLERYSAPDKQWTGLGGDESKWPMPFWTIDAAFAAMIVMLSATAYGVGCWFFGIFQGERALLEELGVPEAFKAIGAIALGYPSELDRRSHSLARGRKSFEDFAHKGRW